VRRRDGLARLVVLYAAREPIHFHDVPLTNFLQGRFYVKKLMPWCHVRPKRAKRIFRLVRRWTNVTESFLESSLVALTPTRKDLYGVLVRALVEDLDEWLELLLGYRFVTRDDIARTAAIVLTPASIARRLKTFHSLGIRPRHLAAVSVFDAGRLVRCRAGTIIAIVDGLRNVYGPAAFRYFPHLQAVNATRCRPVFECPRRSE
jgi:hypothetical protein